MESVNLRLDEDDVGKMDDDLFVCPVGQQSDGGGCALC